MDPLFIIIILIAAFFVVIPGAGAFLVRRRWRRFRKAITSSSRFPILNYTLIRGLGKDFSGEFRAFGSLESIQDDDTIWIKAGDQRFNVSMKNQKVYLLPANSPDTEDKQDIETLERKPIEVLNWTNVYALPQGARVFISGPLQVNAGHGVFAAGPKKDLTIVIYNCSTQDFLKEIIYSGRHRNEYWNFLTPGAIFAGAMILGIYAYVLFHGPLSRVYGIFALTGASLAIQPFIPPGVFLYALYRSLWHTARKLRADRDLFKLPYMFFQGAPTKSIGPVQTVQLPNGSTYGKTGIAVDELGNYVYKDTPVIRQSSLNQSRAVNDCVLFGQVIEKNGLPYFAGSEDPMAEFVAIRGNPLETAKRNERKSYFLEACAVFSFLTGIIINVVLAIMFLLAAIR